MFSSEASRLDDGRADADRLQTALEELRPSAGGVEIELYHRSSVTLRLSFSGAGTTPTLQRGADDGVALRTRSPGGESSFAACSGLSGSGLRWLLDRCRAEPGVRQRRPEGWAGDGKDRVDREALDRLPSPAELEGWAEQARDELAACRSGPVQEMWVEVATTVESWLADRGYRASRSRTRAWAMARVPDSEPPGSRPRPLLVAARRWAELAPGRLAGLLADRYRARGREGDVPASPTPVLFSPETSAALVLALARTLHTAGGEFPVGLAWCLDDDPTRSDALLGGTFDDAGFETARERLADGRRVLGSIAGKGHLRRGSFRDRPAPQPSHLAILTGSAEPPPRGVLVSGLTLHALEPQRWILEIDAAAIDEGRPAGRMKPAFIGVDPFELVRRCVAAVGPPRASHLGLTSPALVFDGLKVEPA